MSVWLTFCEYHKYDSVGRKKIRVPLQGQVGSDFKRNWLQSENNFASFSFHNCNDKASNLTG